MTSKKGLEKTEFVDGFSMPKWKAWNCKKEVFALYVLKTKRCRRSGNLIENGSPYCIEKASQLKPLASKVWFFEILIDFGKLVFLMFLGAGKRRAKKLTNQFVLCEISGRRGSPEITGGGNNYPDWNTKLRFWPDCTFSCLTTPDTGRCRRILAPTGIWMGLRNEHFFN